MTESRRRPLLVAGAALVLPAAVVVAVATTSSQTSYGAPTPGPPGVPLSSAPASTTPSPVPSGDPVAPRMIVKVPRAKVGRKVAVTVLLRDLHGAQGTVSVRVSGKDYRKSITRPAVASRSFHLGRIDRPGHFEALVTFTPTTNEWRSERRTTWFRVVR